MTDQTTNSERQVATPDEVAQRLRNLATGRAERELLIRAADLLSQVERMQAALHLVTTARSLDEAQLHARQSIKGESS